MQPTKEMGYQDLSAGMTQDKELRAQGRTTQQSIDMDQTVGISAKFRQGIALEPSDTAHLVTHRPVDYTGEDQ